jgi:GrpB-like predicted nucleotidyltransferase (UPF0157 family)
VIEIAPYDRGWPAKFETEAARIRAAMGSLALRIEHVGSTAVPGVAAKPVIDIQISVASIEPLGMHVVPLTVLGYTHIPLGPVDLVYPFFQRPASWPSTHHIHLCVRGADYERRHIVFRDYLRNHSKIAAEYVDIKRRLAAAHDGATLESRERYSLSKTEFVGSVVEKALLAGYPLGERP